MAPVLPTVGITRLVRFSLFPFNFVVGESAAQNYNKAIRRKSGKSLTNEDIDKRG